MIRFLLATFVVLCATIGIASAQGSSATYGFVTHSAFFSLEAKTPDLIDPQVFVADPSAAAATGPQGIAHVAGYRPAFGVENPSTPLANAQGKSLPFNVGTWFGARGTVALLTSPSSTTAALAFAGLVPNGRYSLFENHFAPTGVTFTPLDGTGKSNSFTAAADGSAHLNVTVPGRLTHAEAILLVYHSDGNDHGMERGQIGVDAHHQLIMRTP